MSEGSVPDSILHRDQQLSDWYSTPIGQLLGDVEQRQLDAVLPDLFGYHFLQMGSAGPSLLSASRILHKVVLDGHQKSGFYPSQIIGLSEHLPIQPDCVDAVLLHHSLDIATDPRQVLREVERILVPEGHLIILGFNPRSMWGIRRFLSFRSQDVPWGMRFLPVKTIKDWLTLLGFDISVIRYGFFRPPLGRKAVVDRLSFMENWGQNWWPFLGGVYLMVAKKKVATLTPIKPRWRPQRSIVAGLSDAASRSREGNVQG
jgi:SAM-dependent methyltransferase